MEVATVVQPLAWFERQELIGTGAQANDDFGSAVAIDGDTAIIGAPDDDSPTNAAEGSAYIFVRSGSGWVQQARLFATSAVPFLNFGYAVDIEGDLAVVGAPGADIAGGDNQGAVYLFRRSGTTWTASGSRIVASDRGTNDFFGGAVALSGDTLLIGSPYHTVSGKAEQGAAYVITDLAGARNEVELVASDGASSDHFGISVALDGDAAVVGAPDVGTYRGEAYVFERTSGTWSAGTSLVPGEAVDDDLFGTAVRISGTQIIASSTGRTVDGKLIYGAAYFFTRGATAWTEGQRLTAANRSEGLDFGVSLALTSGRVFVGAIPDPTFSGEVHTYEPYQGTYFEGPVLTPKTLRAGDSFSSSVDVSGNTLIVGARYREGPGNVDSEGTAFIYELLGARGDPCDTPGECGSGYCADGVCCETACSGPCDSCSIDTGAQLTGFCSVVTARPGCGAGAGGASSGGASSAGGSSSSGGLTGGGGAGGVPASGGATSSGGAVSDGGNGEGTDGAAGGVTASGGTSASGGASASGGQVSSGGAGAAGGTTSTTGGAASAGTSSNGGASAAGGSRSNDGGSTALTGGAAGSTSDGGEGASSSSDKGGCSCQLGSEEQNDGSPALLGLALGAALVRRRRSTLRR